DSIHAAVRTFLGASRKQEGYLQQRRLLKFSLQQTLTKAERALANMRDNEESRALAGQYETTGKLIMANLSLLDKGMTQIELENPFSTQREAQTISLDPSLPPSKNAERYFNKAKKIRRDLKEHADRKTELERRARTIGGLLEKLEQLDNPEGMKQFTASYHDLLASFGVKLESGSKTKREQEVPFRVFTVAGGFQVWAGKSGENNDLLTMKYAKPNDLWFHARGSSGSHVVLKIGTSKGTPSKLAIQQAAGIAAYYSKMKNAKLVPVAMTERKYVRKRKGASAGTVTLEREKTVFAEPHLPGQ
ncbi:MAG: NFACT RNA binding domain-containing protein, partial [Bacteroidota bacterium]